MTGFSVTELPLGPGHLALCPLPGANVSPDLAQVRDWGAGLVLTLVETSELDALDRADLPDAVQGLGMAWRHFPIADYNIPDPGADWPALSQELRRIVARGGRVMVHCRGGCGRTGMIVLRLMIEMGEDPDAALLRLRVTRPCAVETAAQEDWARKGAG